MKNLKDNHCHTEKQNGVVHFWPDDQPAMNALVKLHKQLLPESYIPKLGLKFIKDFYYSKLTADGLIHGDLYCYDGKFVGFIFYTKYPKTFMNEGIKKHFLHLFFLIVYSVLLQPGLLKICFSVILESFKRKSDGQNEGSALEEGEILSFGVLDEYGFVEDKETGLRISHLLFKKAVNFFKSNACSRFNLAVIKQNRKARLFYQACGGKIVDSGYTSGSSHRLIFDVEEVSKLFSK